MIARIRLDYGSAEVIKKWDRPKWLMMQERLWCLQLPDWPEGKEQPGWWNYGNKVLCDLQSEGPLLAQEGVPFEVVDFKNCYRTANLDPVTAPVHNHLHIAIPNIGLLAVNEVRVMEDSCTDRLQQALDEGWRIIAVCPPNGVRRPDYVLGRTKD